MEQITNEQLVAKIQAGENTALRDLIASDQNLEEDAIKKCDREMMQEELNYIIDSLPEEQR